MWAAAAALRRRSAVASARPTTTASLGLLVLRANATMANLAAELNAKLAADGIIVHGRVTPEYAEILTPEALRFLAKLHRYAWPITADQCIATCPCSSTQLCPTLPRL